MTSSLKLTADIDIWSDLLEDPWKKIKHTLYQANLEKHFARKRLKIIDIGGGDGGDAIPLALQGHDVTLADTSETMLDEARKQARAKYVDTRMTFHHIDLEKLPDAYPEQCFDVVLCHNVIQYLNDMPTAMKILSRIVKKSGIVSVISIKRYRDNVQAAPFRRSVDDIDEKRDDSKIVAPIFDPCVRRFPGNMVVDALQFADCEIVGLYNVRCVVDYIDTNEFQMEPEFAGQQDRLAFSYEHTPYYVTAHFFHIVAQKNHQSNLI